MQPAVWKLYRSVRIKFTVVDVIIVVINRRSIGERSSFLLNGPPMSPAPGLVSRFVKRNYTAMSAAASMNIGLHRASNDLMTTTTTMT